MSERKTDVLVVGGGLGGVAAALTAARLGRRVVLTEPTDWLGGQLTARRCRPTSTPGSRSTPPPGYAELRRRDPRLLPAQLPADAGGRGRSAARPRPRHRQPRSATNRGSPPPCWRRCSPRGGPAGGSTCCLSTTPSPPTPPATRSTRSPSRDLRTGTETDRQADYVVDATELGDLLELAGVEHVIGAEGRDETGELHAPAVADPLDQQAISWCFALEHRPGEDHTVDRPAGYAHWRDRRRAVLARAAALLRRRRARSRCSSATWRLFEPDHARARTLPPVGLPPGPGPRATSPTAPWPTSPSSTGPRSTTGKRPCSAPASTMRPATRRSRARATCRSRSCTGCRPRRPGPTAGRATQGCGCGPTSPVRRTAWPRRRTSARPAASRAEFTVPSSTSGCEARPDGAGSEVFADSVGLGRYRIDLHPSTAGRTYVDIEAYPFQVPLGALIPVRVENLLPADKNIGTTHITNGCYRLHPVEWGIGEAVGALVAFCLDQRPAAAQGPQRPGPPGRLPAAAERHARHHARLARRHPHPPRLTEEGCRAHPGRCARPAPRQTSTTTELDRSFNEERRTIVLRNILFRGRAPLPTTAVPPSPAPPRARPGGTRSPPPRSRSSWRAWASRSRRRVPPTSARCRRPGSPRQARPPRPRPPPCPGSAPRQQDHERRGQPRQLRGVSVLAPRHNADCTDCNPKPINDVIDMTVSNGWKSEVVRLPVTVGSLSIEDNVAAVRGPLRAARRRPGHLHDRRPALRVRLRRRTGGTAVAGEGVLGLRRAAVRDNPNVLYEVFNEPMAPASWATWKSYIQPVVTSIRSVAPRTCC